MVEQIPPPGGGLRSEIPGLLFRHPKADCRFDPKNDQDLLDAKIEAKIGENTIKSIEFSDDKMQAYVELIDKADIELFPSITLRKGRPPLIMERIDLLDVRRYYLVVKGLEDWITIDMIKSHFVVESKGECVESVQFDKEAGTAVINFTHPKVAFTFDSTETEFMALSLQLEVKYEMLSSSGMDEEMLLSVAHPMLLNIPPDKLEKRLKGFFSKHTRKEVTECTVINGVGYLKFESSADINSIVVTVSGLPFFADVCLALSAIPVSEVDAAREEDPLVSLTPAATPLLPSSSTLSSMHTGNSFGREVSVESLASSFSAPSCRQRNVSDSSSLAHNGSRQRNTSDSGLSLAHIGSRQRNTSDSGLSLAHNGSRQRNASDSGLSLTHNVSWKRNASDPGLSLPLNANRGRNTSSSKIYSEVGNFTPSRDSRQLASHLASARSQDPSKESPLFTLPEHAFVAPTLGSDSGMPADVYNVDDPSGQTLCRANEDLITNVLVADVPPYKRDKVFIKSYLSDLMDVTCSIKQCGEQFLASFCQPIDFEILKEKAKYSGTFSFSFYKVNSTKTLLVSKLKDCIGERLLKLHFESCTGMSSVQSVKMLQSNKALITFVNPDHVEEAMNTPHCWDIGNININMDEYYDFMSFDEEDGGSQLSLLAASDHGLRTWDEIQVVVKLQEAKWLERNWQEIKDKLKHLNASCTMSKGSSLESPSCLTIIPQDGSEALDNWDSEVRQIVDEVMSCFVEKIFPLPDSFQNEVVSRAQEAAGFNLLLKNSDGELVIGGHRDDVHQVELDLKYFVEEIQVRPEVKEYSKKCIRFLSYFSKHKLNIDGVTYTLDDKAGSICVKGKLKGRQSFWDAVVNELKNMQEKCLSLSQEQFQLLDSKRGTKKIEELMDVVSSRVLCYLDSTNCSLCFLSPGHVVKDTLKTVKNTFKGFLYSQSLYVGKDKLQLCRGMKWRELVGGLEDEAFISVTVDQSSSTVIVSGEKIVIGDASEKIEKYFLEKCGVEEVLILGYNEWIVISSNFREKMDAIERDLGKHVKVVWPTKPAWNEPVTIILQGDPKCIDDAKVRLEALQKEVCHKEEMWCNIPAAAQLVDSMEDKICLLENNRHASINVSLVNDGSTLHSASTASSSAHPHKLCGATLSNEVRVSLYSGDFTKHSHVDAMFNFIQLSPDNSDANLMQLFATASGSVLQADFESKVKGMFKTDSGSEIKMDSVGQLKCRQLFHFFLCRWMGGKHNEEYFLELCLRNILLQAKHLDTILLAPVCSKPLGYPASMFANKLISLLNSDCSLSSDLTVVIYISDPSEATEFDAYFSDPKNRCRSTMSVSASKLQPTVASGRAICNPVDSFITLLKGDLLKQKAQVYVSSTNTNLDLKTGNVSNALLTACGNELQKECSQYAPLKPGRVAVTTAKNLPCDSIFHVTLLDFNNPLGSKEFKETMQTILRTAKEKNAKSVAIPSLGVGNLNYPARESANIIYDEIIYFCARNPKSVTKYFLVIYDQKVFDEFSKVHRQKKNCEPAKPKKRTATVGKNRSTKLSIEYSDISDEECDIIVNTTSVDLQLSNSAVSKALLNKAGSCLQDACDQLVQSGIKLECGQMVTTKSYGKLKCEKLIHAHVPARADAIKLSIDHSTLIHNIVINCLTIAEKEEMKSVAFPAFGFGQGGYSVEEVAGPMFTALQEFGNMSPRSVDTIKVIIYDQALHKEFSDFFLDFFKVDTSKPYRWISSIASTIMGRNQNQSRFVELQEQHAENLSPVPSTSKNLQATPCSTLLFSVYASTQSACDQIVSELKESIKKKSKDVFIENPTIASLLDTDLDEIRKVGKDLDVLIKIMSRINKIQIQGESMVVVQAKSKVMEILNAIEKTQSELQLFEWRSYGDGGEMETYSPGDSAMLERAFTKKFPVIELMIDQIEVVIDLFNMEERSKSSGEVRRVMRERRGYSTKFPDTWEDQPEVDGRPVPVHFFEVPQGSQEYQNALKGFNETIGHASVTILKLERIQNPIIYSLHIALRDSISTKYCKKKKIEVKELFHGMKQEFIKPITTQGFNRSYAGDANAAFYGCGVYMALKASYSALTKYSAQNKEGVQYMFICSVIIGEYTVGKQGMKTPPALREGSNEVYDTLVEKMENPTIFVAMTDQQAYPEYLVSFKVGKT